MPGDFDFFNDPPAPRPKPRAPARDLPPPEVEAVDDDRDDDPPMARPVGRRPEPRDEPRVQRGRAPKKGPAPLVIVGMIAGAVLLVGGGVAGIVVAVGGGSKPTEPQAKAPPTPAPARPASAGKTAASDLDHMPKTVVERVKKATVYVRVLFENGKGGTGSGFVEKNSQLVVTNAHVVGALRDEEGGPRAIELIFNSGEGENEYHYGGELLAVDREHDLALVRPFLLDVGARQAIPEGLTIPKKPDLSLLQKLFVFGYPLGEELGTEITVSETSISSLRKDPETGKMQKIQVKGGMNPGNSGGPVVDVKGNVVGVAVSIIRGTDLNFAIHGEPVAEFVAKNRK